MEKESGKEQRKISWGQQGTVIKENYSQEMILKLYLVSPHKTLEISLKLTHRKLGALLQEGPRASFPYVDVAGGILRWRRGAMV